VGGPTLRPIRLPVDAGLVPAGVGGVPEGGLGPAGAVRLSGADGVPAGTERLPGRVAVVTGEALLGPGRTGRPSAGGSGRAGSTGGLGLASARRPTGAPRSRRVIRRTARITSRRPAVPVNHNVMVP
jgi:hypothetical protein